MASERSYHHGDLPNALRAATLELIEEVGPTAFSLREVARRAGVSHAAPAHHFGDKAGLLTSVAVEGFRLLAEEMSAADLDSLDDPVERLIAQGRAYVRVARQHPAHFAVMWRPDLLHDDSPELAEAGAQTFGCLYSTLEAVRDTYDPTLDPLEASFLCWSMVQGLVELADRMDDRFAENVLGQLPTDDVDVAGPEHLAERFTRLLVRGLVPGHELAAREVG